MVPLSTVNFHTLLIQSEYNVLTLNDKTKTNCARIINTSLVEPTKFMKIREIKTTFPLKARNLKLGLVDYD